MYRIQCSNCNNTYDKLYPPNDAEMVKDGWRVLTNLEWRIFEDGETEPEKYWFCTAIECQKRYNELKNTPIG